MKCWFFNFDSEADSGG